ncbi:SEFIR domain-containing protein [Streptomyces scabiei]|uniref:SEFIR domain protein n=1 Tax=Streptomyces scabiei TaxID=1930 RepID=A0A100JXF8_STRSC|nr:SEFIR domain-containing protein [Streptomyces scabiei]GAQ67471.1 SEFIR domain protein [Streptomyces scabiei]
MTDRVPEADGVPAADVALLLSDGAGRWLDAEPADIPLGAVRVGARQIHPVLPPPPAFPGHDAYLVRFPYELLLEPDVPGPLWFEVAFRLSCADGSAVVVTDAVPRTVLAQQAPSTVGLDGLLNFTAAGPGEPGAFALPEALPVVDVFGIGGSTPRWRHSTKQPDGVRPGSYSGWVAMLVPEGCDAVDVVCSARFDLGPDDAMGCLPAAVPTAFTLRLAAARAATVAAPRTARYPALPSAPTRPAVPASRAVPVVTTRADAQALVEGGFGVESGNRGEAGLGSEAGVEAAPGGNATGEGGVDSGVRRPDGMPRVFVSYAHDDEPHVEQVRLFADFLARDCGLDVVLDRWDTDRRRDWYLWAAEQVREADFVLVVASPMCRKVGDGQIDNTRHRGLQSELALIRENLHTDRATWTTRLLPVVLPGRTPSDLPAFLQPQSADHYIVSDNTVGGAQDLLRAILRRPLHRRPAPSERVRLLDRLH